MGDTDKNPGAATAAEAEAKGDPVRSFQWEGETWELPASLDDWPRAAYTALEQGRSVVAAEIVFGRDGMRRLDAMGKTKAGDAADLLTTGLHEVYGVKSGESAASTT